MNVFSMNYFRVIRIVLLFCSLIFPLASFNLVFAGEASPFVYTVPKERLMAPAFTLQSTEGEVSIPDDYKGKVMLLNFWSSTCAPCREEMPTLEALWKELAKEGLVVVGINVDRHSERSVKKFMERYEINFPVVFDRDGEVRREYEVMVLPVTYIVGRDGRFIGRVTGVREWSGEEGVKFFKELLDKNGM